MYRKFALCGNMFGLELSGLNLSDRFWTFRVAFGLLVRSHENISFRFFAKCMNSAMISFFFRALHFPSSNGHLSKWSFLALRLGCRFWTLRSKSQIAHVGRVYKMWQQFNDFRYCLFPLLSRAAPTTQNGTETTKTDLKAKMVFSKSMWLSLHFKHFQI